MSVTDAVAVLKKAEAIHICWEGMITELDRDSALMLAAYGDFKVSEIHQGHGEEVFELVIAAQPIKEYCKG